MAKDLVDPKIPLRAVPFDLADVRLGPGPFRDAMERDKSYLLRLDPDRLLHTFRLNVGLPSTAQPYGGWEAPTVELRGHTLGHYLTACALMYRSTGDAELKRRIDYIVGELARCQAASPKAGYHEGYLSAYPESFIDRVEKRQPVWAPWYTLHKIYAGLLDAYRLAGNAQALEVLTRAADWIAFRVDHLTPEQMEASLQMEFGGMNDVLASLYATTGDARHLALARAFDHDAVFDPLARGEDALDGLHANTQIPKAIGAAREYEVTGETRYRDIARFFWDRVALHRSYAIGGHSDRESFFPVTDFRRHLSARDGGDVQHLQHAQAHAAPVRVGAGRPRDGLLRARALQPHPRLAGAGTRDVRVPDGARGRALQDLLHGRGLVLVLRGHRHGEPRAVRRGDLRARHGRPLREPLHRRRGRLEGEGRHAAPGDRVSRRGRHAPHVADARAGRADAAREAPRLGARAARGGDQRHAGRR